MNEFDAIARLRAGFGELRAPDLGIGDDAAVLHDPRAQVLTVDAAVEGVHFERRWLTDAELSARAVEAAVSDLAAMGAEPDALLLAWSLPSTLTEVLLDGLIEGVREVCARHGLRVAGGNLTGGPCVALTTTVLGRSGGRLLRRDGARPGDLVALAGTVGLAAAGLRALQAERADDPSLATAVRAWRRPRAQIEAGLGIVATAHAAIDLSDGLAQDAGHLADASGCAVVLDADRFPRRRDLDAAADALGVDAVHLALHGGEDYALLAAGPASAFGQAWTIIGSVREGRGVHLEEGPAIAARGWDHFD